MEGRLYDGRTAAPRIVDVRIDGDDLLFEADGETYGWALSKVTVELVGALVRLSCGDDARLMLSRETWQVLAGARGVAAEKRTHGREHRLVIGLAAAGVSLALGVFVGLPLASGPLARHTPPALESQLGETFKDQLTVGFRPCPGQAGQAALAQLGARLQGAAPNPFQIRVQAVQAPIMNAFALPGGAVMVTGPLIERTRTPDELSAVIAHEVAHVERRHVMQGMWRALGIGLVLDLVVGGGSGGGQQAVLLAGSFTNLSYDRAAEAEADLRGMQLLQALGLSSRGMAGFFERLAAKGEGPEAQRIRSLISSHPGSAERARTARTLERDGAPAFTAQQWADIKAACPAQDPAAWLRKLRPA